MSDRLAKLRLLVVQESRREAQGGYGSLVRLSKRLTQLADREVKMVQAEHPNGAQVDCAPGCLHCCTRLVEATLPEVLGLVDHIDSHWSEAQVESFLARVDAAQAENGPLWRDEVDTPTAPCPFLADGRCTVYEYRPVSCRSLNSLDKRSCRAFYAGQKARVPLLEEQLDVATLGKAVVVGLKEAGVASGTFELGPAVALFLSAPDLADDLRSSPPELERLKLFSEFSRLEEPRGDAVEAFSRDPAGKRILDYIAAPAPPGYRSLLDKHKGTAADALYAMWLPVMYASADEAEECWAELEGAVQRFEEYRGSPSEVFQLLQGFNIFSWAYADRDALPLTRRLMARLDAVAGQVHPDLQEPLPEARRPGKFRLGFISGRMTNFNGARWALGVLQSSHPEVEVTVYNLAYYEDSTSFCFRRQADRYFHMPELAEEVAARVRADDLDALVFTDVGMDGRSLQLACLQLARRQFTAWGHPASSGAPRIDGYFSSDHMEPADAEQHYSERLYRLPKNGLATPFRDPKPSQKTASELGLPDNFLLYAQYFHKIHPRHDGLFREVARASEVPLVMMGARTPLMLELIKKRLGDEPNIRIVDDLPYPDYLRALQLADASIESPSFGGGFTALDALSVKTPILAWPGRWMRQRLSLGFLREAGLGGTEVASAEAYVSYASDRLRLAEARSRVRSGDLFDNQAALGAFWGALLEDRR